MIVRIQHLWTLAILIDAAACGARTMLDGAIDASVSTADATSPSDAADGSDETFIIHPPVGSTIDAFPDVPIPPGCPDASPPLIEVITQENELYSFNPPTLAFTKIGDVTCPTTEAPFSMAVSRAHIAWSLFNGGELFQIDPGDAACNATTYAGNPPDFASGFGMGYVGAPDGEALYIVSASLFESVLGSLDTTSMSIAELGPLTPQTPRGELTGTADGRLFAFVPNSSGSGSHIYEIDPSNAHIIGSISLNVGLNVVSFAFAFWGGAFWIFTSTDFVTSTVTQYTFYPFPHEQTMTTFTGTIVGAGVSTCAPE